MIKLSNDLTNLWRQSKLRSPRLSRARRRTSRSPSPEAHIAPNHPGSVVSFASSFTSHNSHTYSYSHLSDSDVRSYSSSSSSLPLDEERLNYDPDEESKDHDSGHGNRLVDLRRKIIDQEAKTVQEEALCEELEEVERWVIKCLGPSSHLTAYTRPCHTLAEDRLLCHQCEENSQAEEGKAVNEDLAAAKTFRPRSAASLAPDEEAEAYEEADVDDSRCICGATFEGPLARADEYTEENSLSSAIDPIDPWVDEDISVTSDGWTISPRKIDLPPAQVEDNTTTESDDTGGSIPPFPYTPFRRFPRSPRAQGEASPDPFVATPPPRTPQHSGVRHVPRSAESSPSLPPPSSAPVPSPRPAPSSRLPVFRREKSPARAPAQTRTQTSVVSLTGARSPFHFRPMEKEKDAAHTRVGASASAYVPARSSSLARFGPCFSRPPESRTTERERSDEEGGEEARER